MAFRTTLTLPNELSEQLKELATHEGVPLVELARRAVERYVQTETAGAKSADGADPVAQALRILAGTERLTNPYQRLVGQWRLARAERQIVEVAASKMDIDMWPAEIYLLKILGELFQSLRQHDHLCVVSNLHFWALHSDESSLLKPELQVHYLAAQEQAVRAGMRLHRVFLLRPNETSANELREHVRFVRRLRDQPGAGRVDVEYRVFENDRALQHYGHFACIRRFSADSDSVDQGCMVAEPIYYQSQVHLRLLFSVGPSDADPLTKSYVDLFQQAARGAEPIEKLLPDTD